MEPYIHILDRCIRYPAAYNYHIFRSLLHTEGKGILRSPFQQDEFHMKYSTQLSVMTFFFSLKLFHVATLQRVTSYLVALYLIYAPGTFINFSEFNDHNLNDAFWIRFASPLSYAIYNLNIPLYSRTKYRFSIQSLNNSFGIFSVYNKAFHLVFLQKLW
jgi:hypothetical protein